MPIIETAIGVGGVLLINKIVDVITQTKNRNRAESKQDERDAKLREFQTRRDEENQTFQRQLNNENRKFQLEIEAQRLAFQERAEMRRLQLQVQMEKRREELQRSLVQMNIDNSREIAKFQAVAMRETQILVARENAQNLLQDHMVQNALKDFPLNISPLVLLKNRPHSLSSLLRFTMGKETNIKDMAADVLNYQDNPEALNIFVAPVYVDSKIKNRKVLSDQIWDTTYQKLESFFTEHYNRRSKRPVIFYPTAWNDKYSSGMHASETLHFFLRDMPCLVLEPRFDGRNFRLMISAWNLGYVSTDHIRTELNFDVNIDAVLAQSAYSRSLQALSVVEDIPSQLKSNPTFKAYEDSLRRNILLYDSLKMKDRISNGTMSEIDAFGIYNLFKIEPVQDLSVLADILSAQIGMTLATLTDIHHLRSTDINPILPGLLKQFPELYDNEEIRMQLFESYRKVFIDLRNEDRYLMLADEDKKRMELLRQQQIDLVKQDLHLIAIEDESKASEEQIRGYVKQEYGFEDDDFELVFETALDEMRIQDKPFFEGVLKSHSLTDKMLRNLEKRLSSIK